ncbi:hypothetical protein [Planomonospora venezuelensis]|uniref:Uncharacterized protein YjlB n=1 Tax=Planomonospora venezuelensis TaxID=1999 RepID=A0A841D4W6_PLAVE|nr:hypothetical protein [Planomonospora venezuelensis]MBB5963534.1 uncharacterized protein YjlB [Planomonospora venezuelensis]GIN02052.1 hypothetical protein Pve01_37100 [Planomonospora venezuelensis]
MRPTPGKCKHSEDMDMIGKFAAGAAVTLVALAATQVTARSADAAATYSSPCQGIRNCQAAMQDGEGWMVETPEKNWKKVIYQFKHLKKSARRVCAHEYPRLTMWISSPDSSRHKTVTVKASGRLPRSHCP